MDEGKLPPPPIIVGIVGPPGVGKSTLLRSLVRRFTKHNLQEAQGPITVVSGKTRRITFVECGNDLNSMVDLGKVVDLVLLMIDGSFGFEMVRQRFIFIHNTSTPRGRYLCARTPRQHGLPRLRAYLHRAVARQRSDRSDPASASRFSTFRFS